MTPQLMKSPLTGRFFIVTRYTKKTAPNGTPCMIAQTKYDCTLTVNGFLEELNAEVVRLREIETAAKAYQEWSRMAQEWCGYCDGKNEDHPCSCADKAWMADEKRKALFAVITGKAPQGHGGESS